MKFGLSETTLATIRRILVQHSNVEKAVIYGSRAKGNYKNGSDIDLMLMGDALDYKILSAIAWELDDSFIPYTVDLSLFEKIENPALREHIDRVGVVFYERGSAPFDKLTDPGIERRCPELVEGGVAGMKKGWETKTLGDILQLEYGKPLDQTDRKPGGHYPVYGANGEKDRTDKFYHDKPSIIVGRKGSAGEINLTEKKFWPLDVTYFVTFDESQYDLRFLHHLLTTLELTKLAKGVKPGINRKEVYSQVTRVPPLAEQQRIVRVLDEAFAGLATAKANAEKNLQNARALFESHLHVERAEKAFLGDLVDIKTGKLDANAAVEGGQYPFFTCSRDIFAIDNYTFDCEAILLAGNNAVGDFNVKHYNGKFNAYQRTYVITVNEKRRVLYRFLYFQMLKSLKTFKAQSVGAGTKFLKLGMIKELEIELPSLDEQQRIVSTMDAMREETQLLAAIYEQKLAALTALKKSLLHQAFSGEL